jgi:hypothetical protein
VLRAFRVQRVPNALAGISVLSVRFQFRVDRTASLCKVPAKDSLCHSDGQCARCPADGIHQPPSVCGTAGALREKFDEYRDLIQDFADGIMG